MNFTFVTCGKTMDFRQSRHASKLLELGHDYPCCATGLRTEHIARLAAILYK